MFEQLRAEREAEWARQDAVARLDVVGALKVLDWMLRVDEERGVMAGSDDAEGKSSKMPRPVPSSPPPVGKLQTETPLPTYLPAT
jgi:hypothetical protein